MWHNMWESGRIFIACEKLLEFWTFLKKCEFFEITDNFQKFEYNFKIPII